MGNVIGVKRNKQNGGFMRLLAILVVLAWTRKKIFRTIAWLREVMRKREMLLKLPGPKSTRMHFLGNVTGMVPDDQPLSKVNQYFIREFGKVIQRPELKNEELCVLWVLNENIPMKQ